ncbi:Hypothetical Protein RradSPS_0428 [Rubrobacter radiotolerans]|uniref:HhH-GPD superfamily base excision DNA repair protein n=1 Tax=Rubrobacter radiotolerans TaxID=42256 RepID=A0A023X0H9_RUBRA|nr:hypothetical protein [Rubrobacter radiotolerans]AHY45711.1 Hypothetical Protein RradSPS_0428 [Rubrobacter radiotolerans]MDX5893127.1 hypothetical protein [Rubrobacter radiotolerans]SMC03104.1 hypothetical protein SAMN00767673_0430 [Rubrobacter radiotolerans DSM 5868]
MEADQGTVAKAELTKTARRIADEQKEKLDKLKANAPDLERPDFVWHYLLRSFSTMGGIKGFAGLIDNPDNYKEVTYERLAEISDEERLAHADGVCRRAKVNYPGNKGRYITKSFAQVCSLGGPEVAREKLLNCKGREAKVRFLMQFHGIGPKYARNIMMDVYHEDFHNSIAIDSRIQSISNAWGLSFGSYEEHEDFYLSVAKGADLNGWELDRLMFNFKDEFLPDAA